MRASTENHHTQAAKTLATKRCWIEMNQAYLQALCHHREVIQDDVRQARRRYHSETGARINEYYRKIITDGPRIPFLEHNYAMRMAPVIAHLDDWLAHAFSNGA